MNELDKTPSLEESATLTPESTPAVNPETSVEHPEANREEASPATEQPTENVEPLAEAAATDAETAAEETVVEAPAEAVVEAPAEAASEAETVTAEAEPVTSEEGGESRSWHDLGKEELVATLQEIVDENQMSRHRDVAAIKQAFHAIRSKELDRELQEYLDAGNPAEAFAARPDELEYKFKDLIARFKEGRTAFLAAEEERLNVNLAEKKRIINDIKNIVEDIDNINLHFPRFQELQAEFKSIKDVPPGADNDVWKEYQSVVELFYDRLKMNKELRDLDFRKNLEAKRELIEKAKALGEENDVIAAFRALQELHSQWREIGPVAKEHREEIWAEFSAATTVVNKRHQQYYENKKAAEQANEEGKTKLCEEIEGMDLSVLDTFNKWEEATKQVLDLQQRWKQLGWASKKVNNELFARFRKSCDEFFGAKAEYYRRVKDELAANLEKKTALCEQVEALLESEDRNKVAEKIVALQAEWKTIGGVARRHSDAIWQRFTTACNKFFEERKHQHSEQKKVETENMAAKRAVIEKLRAINPEDASREETIPVVRELQTEWQSIGHVPYKMKDKLYEEYRAECDRIYDHYGSVARTRRRSNFEERIENMASGDGKLRSERDRLYRDYEKKRAELKTFENNLGFFNIKSKGGDSMLKEMEKRIARLKEELTELKNKIELIDDKME